VDRYEVINVGGYHSTASQHQRNISTVSVRGNAEVIPSGVDLRAAGGQIYW
jgi:hypothetical protein